MSLHACIHSPWTDNRKAWRGDRSEREGVNDGGGKKDICNTSNNEDKIFKNLQHEIMIKGN